MPFDILIAQLEQQLPAEPGQTTVAIDPEKLKAVCLALEALLANDDAEVSGILEENSDLLYSAFPNHYRAIENGIRSFDFEAALAALSAANQTSA
jgi:two-component system sensor histidine kinase/response regulator